MSEVSFPLSPIANGAPVVPGKAAVKASTPGKGWFKAFFLISYAISYIL